MGNLQTATLPSEVSSLVFTCDQVGKLRSRFEALSDSILLEPGHVQQLIKAKEDQMALVLRLFCREGHTRISAPELISALILISETTLEEKAKTLFDFYDFEHKLSISLDELLIMLRLATSSLCSLAGCEPSAPQETDDRAREVLAQVFLQRKGLVSFPEFLSYLNKDHLALEVLWRLHLVSDDDLATDFGGEETHAADPELEEEMQRFYTQKKARPLPQFSTAYESQPPTDFVLAEGMDDPPDCHLELDYVHGFRCQDMRNNLKYSPSTGKLLFHAGKVAALMSLANGNQKHFVRHQAAVSALVVTAKGHIAATGESHSSPVIYVWNTESFDILKVYCGLLKVGIAYMAFSPDGARLAALGADNKHVLAIYDLNAKGTKQDPLSDVIASGPLGEDQILSLEYCPNNSAILCACGVNVFLLIEIEEGNIKASRGISWGKVPGTHMQTLLTVGYIGTAAYTGAISGNLIKWQGKAVSAAQKLHEGAITCLLTRLTTPGLVTGGRDGKVIVLDDHLTKKQVLDLKDQGLGCIYPLPSTVCEGQDGAFYVGTRGSEIFEFVHGGAKAVLRGHFGERLSALCAHPEKKEVVTAGADCVLAVWDVAAHRQKAVSKLEAAATAVDFAPTGTVLAVGLLNGAVLVLDSSSFQIKRKITDRIIAISCVKFAKSGEILAVAAEDCLLFLYQISENYKLQFKIKSHRAPVLAIDFTTTAMQSLSQTCDLQFHNVATGKHDPKGMATYKDAVWETWTCKVGWSAQGLYSETCSVLDINCVRKSPSGKVLVTGLESGDLGLVRYPAGTKGAAALLYSGHSEKVTGLCFVQGMLVTIGADRQIFQWHYEETAALSTVSAQELKPLEDLLWPAKASDSVVLNSAPKAYINEVAAMAPANYQEPSNLADAPTYSLVLHKVLGCLKAETSTSLQVTTHGTVLYPAASLVVICSPEDKGQRFFRRDCAEVTALALDPKGTTAASCHFTHPRTDIYIWEARTQQVLSCLSHPTAILAIAFSADSSTLFLLDSSSDHYFTSFDWLRNLRLRQCPTSKFPVSGLLPLGQDEVLVFGLRTFKYISMEGTHCAAVNGSLGNAAQRLEAQLCAALHKHTVVSGTSAGDLWLWSNRTLTKTVKGHEGPVTALYADDSKIISAGREGIVVLWDSGLNKKESFDISEFCIQTGIKALAVHPLRENCIYVCTRGCDVAQIEDWRKVEFISTGHFTGEVWALTTNPTQPQCATGGGDRTIRIWDLETGTMLLAIKPLPQDLRALDWSNDGRLLVAGLVNGVILLLDANSLNTLSHYQSSFKGKDCCVQDIKFSPDANMVAFGSLNSTKVEIIKIQGDKILKGVLLTIGLTEGVTHLDWSTDNSYLILNSRASEVKFVDIIGKAPAAASDVVRVKWCTWTCTLGWYVQGLHTDVSNIAALDTAHKLPLIATAHSKGRVDLYRSPVLLKRQGSRTFSAHSSQVTKVKFSHDDHFLVSIGGADTCVCVWKVQELDRDFPDAQSATESTEQEDISSDFHTEEASLTKKSSDHRDKVMALLSEAVKTLHPDEELHRLLTSTAGRGTVKAWEEVICAPSSFLRPRKRQSRRPNIRLVLDWVHGYRSK